MFASVHFLHFLHYARVLLVKELIKAGLWNSVTRLGEILSTGLDLLITDLFIDANSMGLLAIAKLFPTAVTHILSSIVSSFVPNITKFYALGNQPILVKEIKFSMKITGMILNIPICLTIAFGEILLQILYPSIDINCVYKLAIISILPWAIIGPAAIIHNIFTIVNKIKTNSLLVCFTGLLNVLIVFVLLKFTDLGLYAIVLTSSCLSIIRNILYTIPFGAIYLQEKFTTFYPEILKAILSVIIISFIGKSFIIYFNTVCWTNLILLTISLIIIGLFVNYFIVFNNYERNKIIMFIKTRITYIRSLT